MSQQDWVLAVEGLSKSYPGVQALNDVHFHLAPGSVHALCGGNGAGKSTFLKILMGLETRDSGTIHLKGEPVSFSSARGALDAGISIITQELSPVPDMTVAENLFLGREPRRFGFVDFREMNRRAQEILDRVEFPINARRQMRELSLAEMQLVEIAKAVSQDTDVIIMDEPTSAIGERETETLFQTVHRLRDSGHSIIYVSHRLGEIFEIADSYTVFRDGRFISAGAIRDVTRPQLINMIIGVELGEEFIKENTPSDDVALEVRGLTRADHFHDVSLKLRRGEILGIYGLVGSGRSEFLESLFGVHPADSGEILIDGSTVKIRRPSDAMRAGLALVTEDRKSSGLNLKATVGQNITMASLNRVSRFSVIDDREANRQVQAMIERFAIKTPSADTPVSTMSGGNQQKVVLAKWLLTDPQILLLDEPTRGIDARAKREMYGLISEFAQQGYAVIFVSSEMPEVLGMSDRILVFADGTVAGEMAAGEADQASLLHLAS